MKVVSLGFLSVGIFILLQVILPVISFQIWWFGQKINSRILISPSSSNAQVLGVSVQTQDNFPAFISNLARETKPNYSQFNLTVPRLKIQEAAVYVDSNDLSKGLVQLPGSSLPGEKGNVFISGHSAVSSFFAGEMAIFAKLSDLKKGDEISVQADGIKFSYKVVAIKVVNPDDLSVIAAPESQGRYISLMTCVPPGLNLKRLVVLGKMI